MTDTSRLGLRRPVGADAFNVHTDLQDIVDTLDDAAIDQQGTLAARPAANAVPDGTYYFATDTAVLYRGDGTNWHEVGFTADRVCATRAADLALTASITADITMPTEEFDSNTLHDTGSNTERLTVQRPGVYSLGLSATFGGTPTTAHVYITHYDSGGYIGLVADSALLSGLTEVSCGGLSRYADAGDYFKARTVVTGGSSPKVTAAALRAVRMSP